MSISWAPPQRDRDELLDAGRSSPHDVAASLADLRRINAWLGNTHIAVKESLDFLEKRGLKRATVLDIGTGSADLPVQLVRAARSRGMDVHVIALDCKPKHLLVARQQCPLAEVANIHLLAGDAFRLPLGNESVDLVISSLFLHHFRPPQIELLLREFSRVARAGWVMTDLVRHIVPLLFFKSTWPFFARSYLTRHDGLASFRRAYTVMEMRAHISAMSLPVKHREVKAPFFRVVIVGEK